MVLNLFQSGIKLLTKSPPAYILYKNSFSINCRVNNNNNNMEKIIAISQMCATNDKAANRLQAHQIIETAAKQNACFVFLPECCDYVGTNREETISLAEPLNGGTVNFYKQLAKQYNVWLSLGGIHEIVNIEKKNEPNEKLCNSHILIDSEGKLRAIYRKLHLFDVETPDFRFQESKVVRGGHAIVSPVHNTPLDGGLGLLICYDLRFSELSTILRKNGATILTYPSAFSVSTGAAHWEYLLRARAIENQCFVIASAQVGYHNEKRQSYGHAMVVDPWGRKLAECVDKSPVCQCLTVKIDTTPLENIRKRLPCFDHRRDDVYTAVPFQMISPEKSLLRMDEEFKKNEAKETFKFIFEKFPVPESTTFLETPLSIAFTNITCVVTGHVLVASKRCVPRLKDLTADEIVDFFMTVCKCQRLLEQYYKTSSSTITVQDGVHAGQTVKHVHCHIMPRKEGDFDHNDEIYIELNRHDHPSDGESRRRRSLQERTAEANEYRNLLATFKMFAKTEREL